MRSSLRFRRAELRIWMNGLSGRIELQIGDDPSMPNDQRYQEFFDAFKTEMQEYVNEGFRANDCFPFVFQNLIESTGVPVADRAALQQELMEWTKKIL